MISVFENKLKNKQAGKKDPGLQQFSIDKVKWIQALAATLQNYAGQLSRKSQVFALLLFILVACSYCGWLLSLSLSYKKGSLLKTDFIEKPGLAIPHNPNIAGRRGFVPDSISELVRRYERYRDSLQKIDASKFHHLVVPGSTRMTDTPTHPRTNLYKPHPKK